MIFLCTDFGLGGPYIAQMEAAILGIHPSASIINLFPDLPRQNPRATACLLAAYSRALPVESIFVCVVDPAVGSKTHKPVMVRSNQKWYLGPHNGSFDLLIHPGAYESWEIKEPPRSISATFHGRDLYAPAAARLEAGTLPSTCDRCDLHPLDLRTEDLAEVIYMDCFGNAMTGLRETSLQKDQRLVIAGRKIAHAAFYAAVAPGDCFWYINANALVEIAVNLGSASRLLGLKIGDKLQIE